MPVSDKSISDFEIPSDLNPLSATSNSTSIIILLSDGQSNEGPSPEYVVNQAVIRNVPSYTIGMGTTSWAVPGLASGAMTQMNLDEVSLKMIADDTHAAYYNAENATSLNNIYQKLGTLLVFPEEKLELTFAFNILSAVLALLAGSLSMLWFIPVPGK